MGVYIKGMEMPTSCMLCSFCVEEADPANGEMCMVTGTLMPPCTRERLDNCPLVPVPPHGRLLKVLKTERECVSRDCNRDCRKCDLSLERDEILNAYDTLIALFADPAEEGEA